jgi:hypothetical protein
VHVHCCRIGITSSGTVVVLELKTTQYTTALHKQMYALVCKKQAKMTNGLDYTVSNMHQLQTAFGIIALRRLLPSNIRVGGRVVVCTSDGAVSYACQPGFLSMGLFPPLRGATSDARSTSGTTKNVLSKCPSDREARESILAVLNRHGCGGIVVDTLRKRYGSLVVRVSSVTQSGHASSCKVSVFALVGLLHDPQQRGSATSKFKTARKFLLEEKHGLLKALVAEYKMNGVPDVVCCIVTFSAGGHYKYHRIRGATPSKKSKR